MSLSWTPRGACKAQGEEAKGQFLCPALVAYHCQPQLWAPLWGGCRDAPANNRPSNPSPHRADILAGETAGIYRMLEGDCAMEKNRTFRREAGEGGKHADVWGRVFQAERTASAKALRWGGRAGRPRRKECREHGPPVVTQGFCSKRDGKGATPLGGRCTVSHRSAAAQCLCVKGNFSCALHQWATGTSLCALGTSKS